MGLCKVSKYIPYDQRNLPFSQDKKDKPAYCCPYGKIAVTLH